MKDGANRVLIVVGDQWKDPDSSRINSGNLKPGYQEFEHIAALLKIWGIPFDILRLDQQNISMSYLVDGEGDPLYGCIIWDADPVSFPPAKRDPHGGSDPQIAPYIPLTPEFIDHDYSALVKAVKEKGISLIGIGSRIGEETIQNLLGVKYKDTSPKKNDITIVKDHFISRGMVGKSLKQIEILDRRGQPSRTSHDAESANIDVQDAEVLATQDDLPVLTAKTVTKDSRTVWIGGSPNIFSTCIDMRFILRRALTWCMDFSIYKNHGKTVILVMDDFGIVRGQPFKNQWERARNRMETDDKQELAFSVWSYPAYNKDEIEKYYLKPLKERNAILVHNVVPGIYRPKYGYVVTPWLLKEKYDETRVNDMANTLEGLKNGLTQGVFEIQDHGWTHHFVGPWRRLGDDPWPTSENSPLPRINMLFQQRMSKRSFRHYFNVTPLARRRTATDSRFSINLGGVAHGAGIAHKPRASSRMRRGSRVTKGSGEKLIQELDENGIVVFRGTVHSQDTTVPRRFTMHDRDCAYDSDFIKKLLKTLGDDVIYSGLNEYEAYRNSEISSSIQEGIKAKVDYTHPLCEYFRTHSSTWTLHFSDEMQKKLQTKGKLTLKINGEVKKEITELSESLEIELPEGPTSHTLEISS